jgi:hypothetical protein
MALHHALDESPRFGKHLDATGRRNSSSKCPSCYSVSVQPPRDHRGARVVAVVGQ